MAGVFPGLEHAAELRAHRVDAAHGHGAATDGEVVRRQLPRPHEVSIGRLALAALPQPLAQAELGAGLLIARARQGLEPPCVVRGERGRLAPGPGADCGQRPRRFEAGHVLERVSGERHVVRAHDPPLAVDPEDGGHVDDVVEIGQRVTGVDEGRMSGPRRLDPGPSVIRALVERDRDDHEAVALQLLVERLPDRQGHAAPSPRGIGDEQNLLSPVLAQGMEPSLEVGPREVRSVERAQRATPLARPPPLLDGLGPRVAHQHLRALHLVERAVAWLAFDDDALALASDRQRQLLALEARHGDDARHGEEVGHVLAVVDLVEDRLFGGLDVHGSAEEIPAGDRHGASFVRRFCLKSRGAGAESSTGPADFITLAAMSYDPSRPDVIADPYPAFHVLQAQDPAHWSDILRGWVVTRYADVKTALHDRRLSSDRITPFVAHESARESAHVKELGRIAGRWA